MSENPIEILLIDDSLSDVTLAMHAFKKFHLANHVQVLRDGAAALEYFFGADDKSSPTRNIIPKVILLDLKLPLVSGVEVLRRLKADPHTQCIPVVMLTSSREERDIVECYKLGVNSYIVKPVDFAQFTEAMRVLGMYWVLHNQPPLTPEAATRTE
jgi:two-component system, response regulator